MSTISLFSLKSSAGETKYLKQVKVQGTPKIFWEGKYSSTVSPNLLESINGNGILFHCQLKKGNTQI